MKCRRIVSKVASPGCALPGLFPREPPLLRGSRCGRACMVLFDGEVRHVKLYCGLRNAMPSFRHDSTVTCIPGNGGV